MTAFHDLATSITSNAKGQALLHALALGFEKLNALDANRKAVIFTESRRTQEYLRCLLEANGYAGQVMTFNGTNTDQRSSGIYETWRLRHAGEDVVTNSKAIDLRAALIEHFSSYASVMIATEAAAEGVNLQFCSLVVNYDLPWNPQRIEQRIGRCHRYGQRHDVVVINFLNRRNAADRRVFQILSEKFRLFEGVFGASDEVLGALESGVSFEKRIAEIYQSCRTASEIDAAFNQLQSELEEQISARMAATRASLLENFDEEVHARLRLHYQQAAARLDRWSRWLWGLTRHELGAAARFDEEKAQFSLKAVPVGCPPVGVGRYQLVTRPGARDGCHAYRAGHPLAEFLAKRAGDRVVEPGMVVFDYESHPGKISVVERLAGKRGWLSLTRLSVHALEAEDHLVFAAFADGGEPLDQETCERLFDVGGRAGDAVRTCESAAAALDGQFCTERSRILAEIGERNNRFFEEEIDKLERWAEDLKEGLEHELKELDIEIKGLKKQAKLVANLEAKLTLHRKAKDLEAERSRKRRALYDAQDEVDSRKESLISAVEARLKEKVETERLFTIRWEVR